MSSDTNIVEAMQTIIRTTQLDSENAFLSESVVIDDWDYLDTEIVKEPFCNIETPALLSGIDNNMDTPTNTWQVRATFVKPFVDWKTTRPALRKLRTAVLDHFNSSNNRNLGALASTATVFITSIRDEFPDVFLDIYPRYIPPEQFEEILPAYLGIPVLFEIVEECS